MHYVVLVRFYLSICVHVNTDRNLLHGAYLHCVRCHFKTAHSGAKRWEDEVRMYTFLS
jgi:hypothetical protein